MLSKDEEVALDEVTRACKTLVDHYRELSGTVSDPGLEEMLDELRRRRSELAGRLDALAQGQGRLPVNPDPDREVLERLGARIRAFLGEDERRTLLDQCESWEHDLVEVADAALAEDLEEEAAALVREVRSDAEEACRVLARKLGERVSRS